MERLREMLLGFMVYLLVLGGLYAISDKPQSIEKAHERQNGPELKENFATKGNKTMPFVIKGSTALHTSTNPKQLKDPVVEMTRPPGSSYTQTGRSLINRYNFLEIIPFIDN